MFIRMRCDGNELSWPRIQTIWPNRFHTHDSFWGREFSKGGISPNGFVSKASFYMDPEYI
jgi:hypothetical protein